MTHPRPITAGERFGKLVVIKRAKGVKNKSPLYLCKCDCGTHTERAANNLRRGYALSCGCGPRGRPPKPPEPPKKKGVDLASVFYRPQDMRAGR